jgi:putative toxin-antitoxin system antitoxin component (TIGR02293 family)
MLKGAIPMSHPRSSPQSAPVGTAKRKTAHRAAAKRKAASGAAAKYKAWKFSYLKVYRASPLERISWIKRGIPAAEAKRLFVDLLIGQGVGFKALNLSTATVNRKAKQGKILSREESERVVGFAKLVGQLEAMIEESGDPTGFDARAWMARWLTEPLPAFGGARPADLIDTMEGQAMVSSALAMLQSSAYS